MAYELIETIEVGAGGAASIEFTSIPQDGVDLLLVLSGRSSDTGFSIDVAYISINGVTTNQSNINLTGSGSAASSSSASDLRAGFLPAAPATSNTFSSSNIYVSNYAGSSAKSFSIDSVSENNATAAYQNLFAGLWNSTAAITSIGISMSPANFVQYSTASLYKIY